MIDYENFFSGEDVSPAWCSLENQHKQMDVDLIKEVVQLINKKLWAVLQTEQRASGCTLDGHYHGKPLKWFPSQPLERDTHEAIIINIRKIEK
jgi:hypothetical protein